MGVLPLEGGGLRGGGLSIDDGRCASYWNSCITRGIKNELKYYLFQKYFIFCVKYWLFGKGSKRLT